MNYVLVKSFCALAVSVGVVYVDPCTICVVPAAEGAAAVAPENTLKI